MRFQAKLTKRGIPDRMMFDATLLRLKSTVYLGLIQNFYNLFTIYQSTHKLRAGLQNLQFQGVKSRDVRRIWTYDEHFEM